MKRLLIGIIFATSTTVAYANCVTNTVFSGGRMTVCTTCCYGGNCTTTCM
jgi:hypothetical protein